MSNDRYFVDRIRSSPQWRRAAEWGEPRPSHPEGTVGRHVDEQVVPFIDLYYRNLPDYWNLVALAYLHDIGKPLVDFRDGRIHGEAHSIHSTRIAEELGAPARLVRVILLNDRTFSYWRKLQDRRGRWMSARWTAERRAAFADEFSPASVDLDLLVRFHRADNGYRRAPVLDDSVDPVFWFENRLVEEGLLQELPSEGKDKGYDWRGPAAPATATTA